MSGASHGAGTAAPPVATPCTYIDRRNTQCKWNSHAGSAYCVLHQGCDSGPDVQPPPNPHFWPAFQALLAAGDGNWQGFVFPAEIRLPTSVDFPIDAIDVRWTDFIADNTVFNGMVDLSGATFFGGVALRTIEFRKGANFERCRFKASVDFLNVQFANGSFYRAEFSGRAVLRVNFHNACNFNEAVFKEEAVFSGWRNVSAALNAHLGLHASIHGIAGRTGNPPNVWQRVAQQVAVLRRMISDQWTALRSSIGVAKARAGEWLTKLRRRYSRADPGTTYFRVFNGDAQMQNVVFARPAQTVFMNADLSKVMFLGTNLRGLRFIAVDWWQPQLGRNGIRDEVFIALNPDGPFRHSQLPALEETCRNVRVALEENRSFDVASDFYVGEMDARRNQLPLLARHIFSVPALYRAVSRYGTNVGTALRFLALLVALHISWTLWLSITTASSSILEPFVRAAYHSARLLAFQAVDTNATGHSAQDWIDIAFRIAFPIQLAMLALAFRARIKRH